MEKNKTNYSMTQEELEVCEYYDINPLYTDIKPYIVAYRMIQFLNALKEDGLLKDEEKENLE